MAKMSSAAWMKMAISGAIMCIGGPALIYYVSPTEEELFKKYNPDLQKRSLENRDQRQQDFDDYVNRLKMYSKSDRPIWEVQAEHEAQLKAQRLAGSQKAIEESKKLQEELRRQARSGQ
ncbi:MAG: assembly factor cbp4 [Stictis urceolatum]|nr:assembly factor cbp4 [Stictis urceolata]